MRTVSLIAATAFLLAACSDPPETPEGAPPAGDPYARSKAPVGPAVMPTVRAGHWRVMTSRGGTPPTPTEVCSAGKPLDLSSWCGGRAAVVMGGGGPGIAATCDPAAPTKVNLAVDGDFDRDFRIAGWDPNIINPPPGSSSAVTEIWTWVAETCPPGARPR